jgi:hypothetical protein
MSYIILIISECMFAVDNARGQGGRGRSGTLGWARFGGEWLIRRRGAIAFRFTDK